MHNINFLEEYFDIDPKKISRNLYWSGKLRKVAKVLFVVGVLLLVISFAPSVWYFASGGVEGNTQVLGQVDKSQIEHKNPSVEDIYQPAYDPSLPKQNKIVIATAGIDTPIHEAPWETYGEALKKGVWRVADFGDPYSRELPMIMAAHRFGYLKWSIPYRLKNSFYNLPKLEVGDTVDIVWRQRKYVYEVYDSKNGEEITDYNADLILYTCESLNSPERIFKYARLIEL